MPNATLPADTPALPDDRPEDADEDKMADAFARTHSRWLHARSAVEDPDVESDAKMRDRINAERATERELMTMPAVTADMLWQKLEAFEVILANELRVGPRKDSILMLALGALKTDILNLGLCG